MTGAGAATAGRREWVALAVIALPCLLYSMDLTVLYLALPSLTADLKPSSAQLLWITDVYGFMLAGFLITMGTLGDRIGRRRLLLIGAAAFGLASVLAAFATSVAMLIVARALLGIAAATLAPSTLAGIAVGLAFVRRQQKLAEPLIDLRLFRAPAFSASLAANTLSLFLVFGTFFLIAQYLQLVLGLSPLSAGLWTLPSSLGFIVGSLLAPKIVRRLGPGLTMAYGLGLAAIGSAVLAQLHGIGDSAFAALVTGSVLLALGVAPVVTLATDLIVGAAPPERAGEAAGLSETGTELGGALGIALLGSIATAVYRGQLTNALPAGLKPHDADTARSTLAGATQLAERLPHQLDAPLLNGARDAFTQGLHVAAIVSAALAVALAVIAATVLRRAQPAPESETDTEPSKSDQLRMPTPAKVEPCSG